MNGEHKPGRIRNMLDIKLTVGQVLAGAFVSCTSLVGLVTYVHVTFQTKVASETEFGKLERRIEKVEDGFQDQLRLQAEISGDVKAIRAILDERNKR